MKEAFVVSCYLVTIPNLENAEEHIIWVFFVFFCFPRKISYHKQSFEWVQEYTKYIHFNRDSNDITKFSKSGQISRKAGSNYLIFSCKTIE